MERFTISVPQEFQYEAVGQFLFEDFLQRERCCVTSGLTSELADIKDGAKEEILHSFQENLSLIVVDQEDQSIAGVCINVKADQSDAEEDVSKFPKSRQTIMKFAATLKNGYTKEFENSSGLHLWMLGVREIHSGKGLARKLTERTIELAKQQGMTFVESLATAPATLHLFESMGFETKSEMKFLDFLVDGTPGFPHATSSDLARFTVKKL